MVVTLANCRVQCAHQSSPTVAMHGSAESLLPVTMTSMDLVEAESARMAVLYCCCEMVSFSPDTDPPFTNAYCSAKPVTGSLKLNTTFAPYKLEADSADLMPKKWSLRVLRRNLVCTPESL